MKKVTEYKSRNLRRERNSDLVRRMRSGESLSSFNAFSSWYPPRPVIEKDSDALHRLYGEEAVPLNRVKSEQENSLKHGMRPVRLA